MLYLPELVSAGKVPNVDFLFLYGPASLDALAGWYAIVGHSLEAAEPSACSSAWWCSGRSTCSADRGAAWSPPVPPSRGRLLPGRRTRRPGRGAAPPPWGCGRRSSRCGHARRRLPATRAWLASGVLAGLAVSFRPDIVLGVGAVFRHRRRPQ